MHRYVIHDHHSSHYQTYVWPSWNQPKLSEMRWRFWHPAHRTITTPLWYACLENWLDERSLQTLQVYFMYIWPSILPRGLLVSLQVESEGGGVSLQYALFTPGMWYSEAWSLTRVLLITDSLNWVLLTTAGAFAIICSSNLPLSNDIIFALHCNVKVRSKVNLFYWLAFMKMAEADWDEVTYLRKKPARASDARSQKVGKGIVYTS